MDTASVSAASDYSESGASFLSSPLALWDAASSSVSTAADQAYSSLAVVANSAWEFGDQDDGGMMGGRSNNSKSNEDGSMQQQQQHTEGHDNTSSWLQSVTNSPSSQFAFGSPWNLNKNPYNRVRGRYSQNDFNSSLSAVRSLLPLVADSNNNNNEDQEPLLILRGITESQDDMEASMSEDTNSLPTTEKKQREGIPSQSSTQNLYEPDPLDFSDRPIGNKNNAPNKNNINIRRSSWNQHQNSETASQLAEGSVRALRDIALDEAVEFHAALRYWSDRWEDPMLSWLEAGPTGEYCSIVLFLIL